ncbi:ribosome biogenesis GTP-binding protein YihA/YsxC [Proteinivorax hydrogeniformans]|uniref:Probable GTP-binding protein EngB n=1 Tax=Proteinivorax hydrogeniformans TaxID=1826727 RepID=A0AAU8HWB1_9FIRM
MKIKSAEYILSAVKPHQYPPEEFCEVAFVGRSNVGKSSIINTLANRKNIARTSGKPGKTQTINFYEVNNSLMLVDLPGYGFAKVSKQQKAGWKKMIESYLLKRTTLKGVVQLIDLRHKPTSEDQDMFAWLLENKFPVLLVATKSDKLSNNQVQKNLKELCNTLGVPKDYPIIFSALTKVGREEVWESLHGLLEMDN